MYYCWISRVILNLCKLSIYQFTLVLRIHETPTVFSPPRPLLKARWWLALMGCCWLLLLRANLPTWWVIPYSTCACSVLTPPSRSPSRQRQPLRTAPVGALESFVWVQSTRAHHRIQTTKIYRNSQWEREIERERERQKVLGRGGRKSTPAPDYVTSETETAEHGVKKVTK